MKSIVRMLGRSAPPPGTPAFIHAQNHSTFFGLLRFAESSCDLLRPAGCMCACVTMNRAWPRACMSSRFWRWYGCQRSR